MRSNDLGNYPLQFPLIGSQWNRTNNYGWHPGRWLADSSSGSSYSSLILPPPVPSCSAGGCGGCQGCGPDRLEVVLCQTGTAFASTCGQGPILKSPPWVKSEGQGRGKMISVSRDY